ncbi:MAG: hypothetical protein IJ228_06820 [Succinivibrio sp.]|nr:hypothetical protein [Succinivibrio sp.]
MAKWKKSGKKYRQNEAPKGDDDAISLMPYSTKAVPKDGEVWFSRHIGGNEFHWKVLGGSTDYLNGMASLFMKDSKEFIPRDNLPPGSPLKGFKATEVGLNDAMMWMRVECGTRQDPDKSLPVARVNIVPMAVGMATELIIEEVYTWSNHYDGEVKAHFDDESVPLTFQDPYFMEERDRLTPGERRRFFLYGVAVKADLAHLKNEVCKPTDPHYQRQLKLFLAENPGKTAADMPQVVLRYDSTSALVPDVFWTFYEFLGPVHKVSPIKIFGGTVYQALVQVQYLANGNSLTLPIYVKDELLEGKRPLKTGDHLHGRLLLLGSMFCHVGLGTVQPESWEEAERLAHSPLVMVDHTLQ